MELASAGLAPGAAYALDEKLRADGGAFGKPAPARVVTSRSVLFVGDAAPHVSGASLASLLKLLAAAGIAAPAISQGRSSGLTASTLGFRDTAVSLARAVVADVVASGAKEVLVMSPGDRWTFTHVYPSRLGVEWPADVEVREAVTVLAEAVAAGRLNFRQSPEAPYAYHDPCHAPRVAETRPAPRALLAAALGDADARRFFFREHRAHPCGATGGLDVTSPAIASQLAASRLADAERAGASLVITEDPACLSQLSAAAGGRVAVKGLFEVLAARL